MSAALAALRDPIGWLGAAGLLTCFFIGAALGGPSDTEAAQDTADRAEALAAAQP